MHKMKSAYRILCAYVIVFLFVSTHGELVQIVTPEIVTEEAYVVVNNNSTAHKRETPTPLDSYLQALKVSQGSSNRLDPPSEGAEDAFYKEEEYIKPSNNEYGPPQGYEYNSPPSYHSGPKYPSPPVMYGPPVPFNPPHPSYGAGSPFSAPPSHPLLAILPSLIPKGLDLETVFKLILKFVLFKLIIKFVAVTCLMFVWPLFHSKEKAADMDEDRRRQFEVLDDLTETVWKSIFPMRKNGNGTNAIEEETDEGIVEKVAGHIDEKMTQPSEDAAIGFLEFCVSAANSVVGWMMSFLRRRNNEVDPLEELALSIWNKFKYQTAITSN